MEKLISVEDARAYALEHFPSPVVRRHIDEVLDRCPGVEIELVPQGQWVMIEGFWACNKCGASPADWEAKPNNPLGLPPYCHSCGTKMDEGDSE